MAASVKRASDWLARSGIQNTSRDVKLRGGVAAWYETDKKLYPFLYSEITGYALSALVFLHTVRPHQAWLAAAERAARWLIRNALLDDGGVKTRLYLVDHYESPNYSFDGGRVYAFDTAMVGYGLLQLFKRVPRSDYAQAAHHVLDFLTRRMGRPDGTFWPYYDPRRGKCGEDLGKWSDQAGTFHAKLALFLIDFSRRPGYEALGGRARLLLDRILGAQKADGRFVTGRKDNSTHLHPHAYTIEGLLYGGVCLKNKRYLDSAFRAFEWMLRAVSRDGSVSSLYTPEGFSHHERSDIVAQLLRIGAILHALEPKRMRPRLATLEAVKRHLLLFQSNGAKASYGGFIYGAATDGLQRPHVNAWATMFALQALWMHEHFVEKGKPLTLECFV
jgi:hypothetical protein